MTIVYTSRCLVAQISEKRRQITNKAIGIWIAILAAGILIKLLLGTIQVLKIIPKCLLSQDGEGMVLYFIGIC